MQLTDSHFKKGDRLVLKVGKGAVRPKTKVGQESEARQESSEEQVWKQGHKMSLKYPSSV